MLEIAKEIVITMLENDYIEKYSDTDKNIENVNKALDDISQKLFELQETK